MKLAFKIPRKLPSANAVLNLHPMARHKTNKQWYEVTRMYYLAGVDTATRAYFQNLLGEPVKYRVVITAYLHRLYDEDNIWVKAVLDALKGIIITDDSPKYCQTEKHQVKIPKATAADKRKGINGQEPYVLVEVEVFEP